MNPKDLFNGYIGSHLVYALAETGVLDALAEHGPQPVSALAESLNLSEPLLAELFEKAARLAIISRNGELVELTDTGADVVRHRGFFTWAVGGAGHVLNELPDILNGKLTYGVDVNRHTGFVAKGSAEAGTVFVDPVVRATLDRIEFGSVADIGCGDGTRIIDMVRRYRLREAIGIDVSAAACELVQQKVIAHGLADRISVINDDALAGSAGRHSRIELVTSFFLLHDLLNAVGPSCLDVLRARFPAARWFVFADTARSEPGDTVAPQIFTLGFELMHAVMGIPTRTAEQYRALFASQGFGLLAEHPLNIPHTWLYVLEV